MGNEQITKIRTSIEALSFPILMGIVIWFGARYLNTQDENQKTLIQIQFDIRDIKNGLDNNSHTDQEQYERIKKLEESTYSVKRK